MLMHELAQITGVRISDMVNSIDIEVSRLAIVCPCQLRIMILCYSPRPKSG